MTLSDIAIRRPVFTIVLQLVLIVLGVMSLRSLGTDLFPDVSFPVVTVTTIYPGASPSEVEAQVTKPLEDAVAGIADLDTVRSMSRESVSVMIVMFKMSADIDKAAQDVRDRISAVRTNLPTDARDPTVRRIDVGAAPVMTYVAAGAGLTNEELKRMTEDVVKPQLERVPGVAAVEVTGGHDREVQVELDRKKLDALNLPLTGVVDKLRMENLSLPAGHFSEGDKEISVRLAGDMRTAEEVAKIVVATTPSGTQIRLGEIAKVYDGLAEARTTIRANGREAVAFEVIKQSGTNTVQVVEATKKKLADIQGILPKGYQASIIIDQSTFIQENAHEVEIAIVYGGIMAILVILLFMLDLRSTFISALALPTSVIGTFWIMSMLGFTLNMMTLLALSLAIGLLIDDAVVVRENIFRHLEAGEDPKTAASKGTSEIALAVLATTLTIVAVFLPVAFMQGVVGQFFRSFGLTISAATLLSLFVAFTLDPMLSSRLAVKIDHDKKKNIVVRFFEAMHQAIEDAYVSTLKLSVRHRIVTVLIGVAAFLGAAQLATLMGSDFVAQEDRGQFLVDVELPPGTSLDETGRLLLASEKSIKKIPDVVTVYSKLGPNTEVNKAQLRIVCTQKTERSATIWEIQDKVRAVLAKVPHAKITVLPPAFVEGLPSGAPLQVQVRGSDLASLERDAAAVEQILKSIPGVGDLQVAYAPGKPEQTVRVDRKRAADLGIPVALVARTLRAALEGEEAGKLRVDAGSSKEVKIRVRLAERDRASVDRLMHLQIPVPPRMVLTAQGPVQMGGFVPLSAVATLQPEASPQVIERQDRTRQISVTAVPKGRSLGEIVAELEPRLQAYQFTGDGYYRLDGMVKQMKESGESFGLAGLLAVVFIFLILASQFESFLHPLTIMLSLPLAMIGAWLGLFLTDNSLSMGSNIGVILLMGLVTKNGILLVDAALQLQRDGAKAVDAIVEAGRKRLRPILMTSAAMILGMMPTAVVQGPGSEFRSPMAIAVIGGVITSTILTLLVLPSVFLWFDAGRSLPGRLFRPRKPAVAEPTLELPALKTGTTGGLGIVLLVAAGLLLTPGEAHAQAALTLKEAVARAWKSSPDLRVAEARLREAQAQRSKIRTAWLPDVKAVGSYTHNSTEAVFDSGAMAKGMAAAFGLTLTPQQLANLPPPTVIQRQDTFAGVVNVDQTLFAVTPLLMADAADRGVTAQKTGIEAARREIAFRIGEVFYNAAGLARLKAAAERALQLTDKRLSVLELRKGAGAEGDLPMLRAKVERARAEQDLLRATLARRQLMEVLSILTGETPPAELQDPPAIETPAGDVAAWMDQAIKQRPDLLARRQAVEAQQALVREAELRWLPIVAANGYWRYSDTKGFTGENTLWAATVNLVVPIFDRGTRYADLHERRQGVLRLQAEVDKAEAELRAQVRQASNDVQNAREVLRIARLQSEIARRSADIAAKSVLAGVATSLEQAEADTALRLSEANEERERINLDLAVLKLRHLLGDSPQP